MDSRYRFLTLGTPWTQSMPSRDVNAVTRLAEASWRRDKAMYTVQCLNPTSHIFRGSAVETALNLESKGP